MREYLEWISGEAVTDLPPLRWWVRETWCSFGIVASLTLIVVNIAAWRMSWL